MKKIVLAFIIVFFVLSLVYFIRLNLSTNLGENVDNSINNSVNEQVSGINNFQNNSNLSKSNSGSTSSTNGLINSIILAKHNNQKDCWVAYNSKVYDLTAFLPRHPGSAAAISPYCGTSDGFKNAFEGQHGTRKVNMLMKVGTFIGDFQIVGKSA